ncbi:MAG: MoaD/ThiS family protein [Anaerolineales bacterium]
MIIMTILKIPTPLRYYTAGQAEISVHGADVAAAMRDLVAQFPALEPHLYNGDGQLRAFVNLFVGEDNIKDLDGLQTPLSEDDILRLIPSIAGGSLRLPTAHCSLLTAH